MPANQILVVDDEVGIRELLETIQDRQLRQLLDAFFAPDSPVWERFREAPAAKYYHQAYRHGLLDHTVSVAQAVSAAASGFPGIDRDVAVAGALLHDIGKTMAYNDDPLAIDLTDAGRLQGEIPLGYYLEDYGFVNGAGDLDQYNGRFTVTPEYPQGTYAYFATVDASGAAAYPYLVGPRYYGVVATDNLGNGNVVLPGDVTYYAVPEPTVLSTIGLGFLGFLSTRRRFSRG